MISVKPRVRERPRRLSFLEGALSKDWGDCLLSIERPREDEAARSADDEAEESDDTGFGPFKFCRRVEFLS